MIFGDRLAPICEERPERCAGVAEAERELCEAERAEPTGIVGGRWPRFVAGSAGEVRSTLAEMIEQSHADEVIVQDMIADPEDGSGSHERLAKALGLAGQIG